MQKRAIFYFSVLKGNKAVNIIYGYVIYKKKSLVHTRPMRKMFECHIKISHNAALVFLESLV
jgi:hypothetical protein